jgi:hypothetical protein
MVSRGPRAVWSSRRRVLAGLALGFYAILLAVSPVLCHDLACHVKSATHCDACQANPLASPVETRATLHVPPLPAAGETPCEDEQREEQGGVARTSGRSPPA